MDVGQVLVIGLSAVLASWLVWGIWYNRRRAGQVWSWLGPGVAVLGGRAGAASATGAGAGLRLALRDTRAPFHRAELFVRLAPRENLPLWLFERVQGKGDQLGFQGWLRTPQPGEIEVVPAGSRLERSLRAQTDSPWQCQDVSPGWLLAWRGQVSETRLRAVRDFIAAYARQLCYFSQRRVEPHLVVQMALDELTGEPSREILSRIREAASVA